MHACSDHTCSMPPILSISCPTSCSQFEKAHEYTRALNAAKVDRIFAKPFVAALPHDDGVTALCRSPRTINRYDLQDRGIWSHGCQLPRNMVTWVSVIML